MNCKKGNARLKVTNENGIIYFELIDEYNSKEEYNKGYNRALSDIEHDILSKIKHVVH
jgi:hypothetical protein